MAELQDAREFLGISESWHIHAKQTDRPGGNDDADGWCAPDYTYLNAKIEFSYELDNYDTAKRRAIAIHEMMHVALAEVQTVGEQMLWAMGKKDRRRYQAAFDGAIERYIQQTSRAIARHLKPTENTQPVEAGATDDTPEPPTL